MAKEEERREAEDECRDCGEKSCSAHERVPGEAEGEFAERRALAARLCQIKHKVIVLSGKGGVGKSTVSANLAVSLALAGHRVGLLDIDIHGPSIPRLLGLTGRLVEMGPNGIYPLPLLENLAVMSIGFLLRSETDAVIWRGPMKYGVIKQFIKDVDWGERDFLIVDSPPGTGDEPLSIVQLLAGAGGIDGALVVTTPQEVSVADVRRSITFCRQLNLPVLGLVENMSGFACPHCGQTTEIFGHGGGERLAAEMEVELLGRVPLDPQVVTASDEGRPYVTRYAETATARAFEAIVEKLLARIGHTEN